jgi:hypothetical protein
MNWANGSRDKRAKEPVMRHESVMSNEIKQVIINHCSPVLLGCKPAALFPMRSEKAFSLLSRLLQPRLSLKVLRKTGNGLLVLVFEKGRLWKTLLDRDTLALLAGIGYPTEASLFVLLDYLGKQCVPGVLPHEIGLFLGYPIEDVLGFVQHKGQNYKFCGYWKVYGDVEHAKKQFRRFDTCRECVKAFLGEQETGRRTGYASFNHTDVNVHPTPQPSRRLSRK